MDRLSKLRKHCWTIVQQENLCFLFYFVSAFRGVAATKSTTFLRLWLRWGCLRAILGQYLGEHYLQSRYIDLVVRKRWWWVKKHESFPYLHLSWDCLSNRRRRRSTEINMGRHTKGMYCMYFSRVRWAYFQKPRSRNTCTLYSIVGIKSRGRTK